ncbi:hypothetical protein [Flavobacterium cellulosilyticum]|uniref:Uncharacterized protein n=1 Tax=Flavobacterium cellulosilyticum TaxID=2541731 RepID=A0A4R5CC08_9FLAO|nr:hypothetical protein [Flavobacterium cellulosilyticum]TDD94674.1 hypothetical protein E0F76_15655 [Flavobacterium cellulosilyticum]
MKKLAGQGGLTKKISTAIGNSNKAKFLKEVDSNLAHLLAEVNQNKVIAMEVASFSSCNDYPEQLLSLLSYVRYVGIPIKWTIYSDGSHTQKQIDLVESNFNFVVFKSMNFAELSSIEHLCKDEIKPYHTYILDYGKKFALGRRLFYYLHHKIEVPTLFIDSDILFYDKASLFNLILTENPKPDGWFMPDPVWGCLDSKYKEIHSEQFYQVNAGLMMLTKEFEVLKNGLDFFKTMNFEYEYFSDQTIFQIILKDNSFMPLTPKTFILDIGDQFDFSYLFKPKQMAVRHYTGPVRHKMWQNNYKWHLGL